MVNYVEKGIFNRALIAYIQFNENDMKILIVDDNSKMREMMRTFLEDVTEKFYECDDGVKALSLYTQSHPDLVLMDWEMKEMDGITATRQIISVFPEANILLVTQYDDNELKSAAREAGATGFVLKDDLQSIHQFCTKTEKQIEELQ